jgi:Protein of unknown function (DUF1353)
MEINKLNEIHSITAGEQHWIITQDYHAYGIEESRPIIIKINAGFKTDYCTVPRLPIAYWLLGNMGKAAGLLHDALYSNYDGVTIMYHDDQQVLTATRMWSDQVLLNALHFIGMSWWRARLIYTAVRLFGAFYYKKDKQSDHKIYD